MRQTHENHRKRKMFAEFRLPDKNDDVQLQYQEDAEETDNKDNIEEDEINTIVE